jgi:hypothetical protein
MRRNGVAHIKRVGVTAYDVHIAVPWHGRIQVIFPRLGRIPYVMHHVAGKKWKIERGQRRGRQTVFTLRALSIIDYAKCIKVPSKSRILRCLVRAKVKSIPKDLAVTLFGPCGGPGIVDMIWDACKLDPGLPSDGPGTPIPLGPQPSGPIQGSSPLLQGGAPSASGGGSASPLPESGGSEGVATGGSGRMMIINGCGSAYAKDSISPGGWIQQTACGDARAVGTGG